MAMPSTEFTLRYPPEPGWPVQVYRNGLLMADGEDYTAAGRVLTFHFGGLEQGDIVQVLYTTVEP